MDTFQFLKTKYADVCVAMDWIKENISTFEGPVHGPIMLEVYSLIFLQIFLFVFLTINTFAFSLMYRIQIIPNTLKILYIYVIF